MGLFKLSGKHFCIVKYYPWYEILFFFYLHLNIVESSLLIFRFNINDC